MGKEAKFKVGDKVRVVRPRLDHKEKHKGIEFTIENQEYDIGDEASWFGRGSESYVWAESELELVHTSPVRERTIKEVVTGLYGIVRVDEGANAPVVISMMGTRSVEELTEAINHLTAIRDALASKE